MGPREREGGREGGRRLQVRGQGHGPTKQSWDRDGGREAATRETWDMGLLSSHGTETEGERWLQVRDVEHGTTKQSWDREVVIEGGGYK